jgi:hypothetical protein
MKKAVSFKPYVRNIEEKIIESIKSSKLSIKIAMAWFTSREIKQALVNHKLRYPEIIIEVLVDNNKTNDDYFYNSSETFLKAGIIIHQERPETLHHKFMVLDGSTTIMGSYNYSAKAKINLESICVADSLEFSTFYSRVFASLTDQNYSDENIGLLMKYPKFARQILSVYYPFSQTELSRYKDLLIRGSCYTYDYGFGDRLVYEPGYLFNGHLDLSSFRNQEFKLPFTKKFILEWQVNNNMLLILDSYAGDEEQYHLINESLEQSEQYVRERFQRIIDNTFTADELEKYILKNVDIIIEDRLWSDNFELFMRPGLLEKIFHSISAFQSQVGLPDVPNPSQT